MPKCKKNFGRFPTNKHPLNYFCSETLNERALLFLLTCFFFVTKRKKKVHTRETKKRALVHAHFVDTRSTFRYTKQHSLSPKNNQFCFLREGQQQNENDNNCFTTRNNEWIMVARRSGAEGNYIHCFSFFFFGFFFPGLKPPFYLFVSLFLSLSLSRAVL